MNFLSQKRSVLLVTLCHASQILQPTLAADVYPAPPQPPRDAFAPQWQAPKPTLTGRRILPASSKFIAASPFTSFSAAATLKEVDSASLTQVPLTSPSIASVKATPDAALKQFLQDHQMQGGVLNPGCISKLSAFLATHPDSPFRYTMMMELADAQWRHGWFMESLVSYRSAWDLGKTAQDPQDAALGQVALCHLLTVYSATGAKESLKTLLEEVKDLNLSAAAKECCRKGESLIWHLEHKAE